MNSYNKSILIAYFYYGFLKPFFVYLFTKQNYCFVRKSLRSFDFPKEIGLRNAFLFLLKLGLAKSAFFGGKARSKRNFRQKPPAVQEEKKSRFAA